MADIRISVGAGTQTRLLTAGKYCADDILVTASGGIQNPPDDGKTRLYIHVPENAIPGLPPPRADVPLYISQTVSGGVSIEWGDNSPAETINGTGNVNTTHHYNAGGDYVIVLTVADGCELRLAWGTSNYCVLGAISNDNVAYQMMLRYALLGNGVNEVSYNAFNRCYGLQFVKISESAKSIAVNSFLYCYGLASIHIPSSVESLAANAFLYCYGVKEYHFQSITPPTIQTSTFTGIVDDCIIYAPAGAVDAYKTATNWAALADRIQEEPAT